MPSEVKQRKKTPQLTEQVSDSNCKDETQKMKTETGEKLNKGSSGLDLKCVMCLLSFTVCGALSWMVLQHNERFSQIEKKYKSLEERNVRLLHVEEEIVRVSEKLAASEDDLLEALSSVSVINGFQRDVSGLHAAMGAMQVDSASHDLQAINAHFLDVTETWQERLTTINIDLAALKAEARNTYVGATERVNEAERRAQLLVQRLQELEDSTRRNARALERTEEEDAKRAQDELDWNTKQIHQLEEQMGSLGKREEELTSQFQELLPRARECEEQLPKVEEAVRTILRLGEDLSGAERRLEEATLQVLGTEDSMLKALNQILHIRQELDTLQGHHSILKMKNELSMVKEAVHELTMVLRESRGNGNEKESGWKDKEEEEWEELTEPPHDDLTQ